jgi:hypothetical protein
VRWCVEQLGDPATGWVQVFPAIPGKWALLGESMKDLLSRAEADPTTKPRLRLRTKGDVVYLASDLLRG